MRIIRNERRIHILSLIGQYAPMGGMLTLAAGLLISFVRPQWVAPMLASIMLGYSLSVVGGFFADRYVGKLAHHDALAAALKGLDDNYLLLQYVLPASHVLVEPGGCTVFVVKIQGGEVTCRENGRWKHRQRGKLFRQFAGQEPVGSPHLEAERQVRKTEHWLTKHLPDIEVPVRAAIVFVNPEVTLDADDSPTPTFYGKKVKNWLRGPGKRKRLPDDVRRRLAEALDVDQSTGA
jgi:hypothetical protein